MDRFAWVQRDAPARLGRPLGLSVVVSIAADTERGSSNEHPARKFLAEDVSLKDVGSSGRDYPDLLDALNVCAFFAMRESASTFKPEQNVIFGE
jgi:hypothetical protein